MKRLTCIKAALVLAVLTASGPAQEISTTRFEPAWSGLPGPAVSHADFLTSELTEQEADELSAESAGRLTDTEPDSPSDRSPSRLKPDSFGGIDASLGDTSMLDGLLWQLSAVLAFTVMTCLIVARNFRPGRKVGGSDSRQLAMEATLALPHRTTLTLVTAAGHTLVVASDNSGVQSVTRLPELFGNALDETPEGEVSDA